MDQDTSTLPMAKSQALRKTAEALIPSACCRIPDGSGDAPQEVFVARGSGATVVDADGNEYIDYDCGRGSALLGHADERIGVAINKINAKGVPSGSAFDMEVKLAELIIGRFQEIEWVSFAESRRCAVCEAAQVARRATGREMIAIVAGGSDAAPSSMQDQSCSLGGKLVFLPPNDVEAAVSCFGKDGSKIAAVVAEPIKPGQGIGLLERKYLSEVSRLCKDSGSLLVVDEADVRLRLPSRDCSPASEIEADLTILGGPLGGGLPLAVVGGKASLAEHVRRSNCSSWSSCSGTNPLAVASAIAILQATAEDGFYDELEAVSVYMHEAMQAAVSEVQAPITIRRVCSVLGLDFVGKAEGADLSGDRPSEQCYAAFYRAMLERGVFLGSPQHSCLFVSAAHTKDHVDDTVAAVRDVLRQSGK